MIAPYGASELRPLCVADADRPAALETAARLPQVHIGRAAAANAVMLGGGYFTPLTGFMNRADALGIADSMHTADGLFWPVPILCRTETLPDLDRQSQVTLCDPHRDHAPLGILQLENCEQLSTADLEHLCQAIYRTTDAKHPGVAEFLAQGEWLLSGALQVLNHSYFADEFPQIYRTAPQLRAEIAERGWQRTVAFQTRNPMHRAHEEICRLAMERTGADGCLIHMLLGRLKPGDLPADVRFKAIQAMADSSFPAGTCLIAGYGFDMLYAGPREAVLHAIFRQNAGATHFIIGRDHAGVDDYYGAFDAQTIFDDGVPPGTLAIEIFRADHTVYSRKLNRVVMLCEAPDHGPQDFMTLSGTKLRQMLQNGEPPPPEIARAEVAQILIDYYQSCPNNIPD